MFSISKIVIFLIIVVQIVQCNERPSDCTKNDEFGTCLPLEQCPGLYHEIQYLPKPYNVKINATLRKYACEDENNTKVCCVQRFLNPIEFNITSHPKINLLPNTTVCGIPTDMSLNYPGNTERIEYPFMAILIYRIPNSTKYRFGCGGSIISARYVLTAAHCLYTNNILKYVRVGAHDLNKPQNCNGSECPYQWMDIEIENRIPHPDYIENKSLNDIALIRLTPPMIFANKHIKPICLPLNEQLQNRFVTNFIDVGWGSTLNAGYSSTYLKSSSLPVVLNKVCKDRYPNKELEDKQLCAAGNTCHVDSGGPAFDLMIIKNHVRYVQFGISTSTVLNCRSGEETPVIYTRVSKYILWILSVIH